MEELYELFEQTRNGNLVLTEDPMFNQWLNTKLQNNNIMNTYYVLFKSIENENPEEMMKDGDAWKKKAQEYMKESWTDVDLISDYIDIIVDKYKKLQK